MSADPKSSKHTVKLSVFFLTLLVSAHIKAAHKMLAKLTPGCLYMPRVDCNNNLGAALFSRKKLKAEKGTGY